MSTMNIAGDVKIDDPEYRYKMPRLIAKIEGRGNGIKTVVMNCVPLADSLHRSASEVCKFFGCELGAQSKYDEATERAVINGAFDSQAMQSHLSKYIEGFVLCPGCRLPETKYKFKGQLIYHKCLACGAVEPVDMNHKLTTFILKEHSKKKKSSKKTKEAKDEKKKKKKERQQKEEEQNADDVEVSPKEKKEKKSSKKKDKKRKSKEKVPAAEEVEWHTDLSEEAVAARAREAEAIEAAARSAMKSVDEQEVVATLDNLTIDDEEAVQSAAASLRSFLHEGSPSNASILDKVQEKQTFAALPIAKRLDIFFIAACDNTVLSNNLISKYSEVFSSLVKDSKDAQYHLIALCEEMCAVTYTDLQTSFPIVLKLFYDEDILDEEVLLSWNKAGRAEYSLKTVNSDLADRLQKSLEPFLEWLQNAEEESDDDDDEE